VDRTIQEHSADSAGGHGMNSVSVSNPFYHRGAVIESEHFYGRKRVLVEIWDHLHHVQSCSIVGERRIGKSSLLHQVADASNRAKKGLTSDRSLVILFDFQGMSHLSPTQCWRLWLQQICQECEGPELRMRAAELSRFSEIPFFEIENLIRRYFKGERQLLFLLDELEYAARSDSLDADFFGGLRNLAMHYDVAFVTATQTGLLDLHYSETLLGSPFFNIFDEIRLGGFEKEEALAMIHGYLQGTPVVFNGRDEVFLFDLAGYFPFFLQLACYYLFQSYVDEPSLGASNRYGRVRLVVAERCQSHFQYYWKHCSDEEKAILTILAFSKQEERLSRLKVPDTLESVQRDLVVRGLVVAEGGEHRVFSSLFRDWIIGEVRLTADKNRVEDFDTWLASAAAKQLGTKAVRVVKKFQSVFLGVKPVYWGMIGKLVADSIGSDTLSAFFDALTGKLV